MVPLSFVSEYEEVVARRFRRQKMTRSIFRAVEWNVARKVPTVQKTSRRIHLHRGTLVTGLIRLPRWIEIFPKRDR